MGTDSLAEVDQSTSLLGKETSTAYVTPPDSPLKHSLDLGSSIRSPQDFSIKPQESLDSEVEKETQSNAAVGSASQDISSDMQNGAVESSISEDVHTDLEVTDTSLSDSREVAKGETVVETPAVKDDVTQVEEHPLKKIDTQRDEALPKADDSQVSDTLEEEEIDEITSEQSNEPEAQTVERTPEPKSRSSIEDVKPAQTAEPEDEPDAVVREQESPDTGRDAQESEIQEAQALEPPSTPPTPERSGAVIRLTRQMSRVSTGMGPMSPRFEIRASKELNELQEKVRFLEEELRSKTLEYDRLTSSCREKESHLMYKIECLELANEQLLEGGNDSSIQLQMELTRLQRQNSVLSLRERELQFQISTQEMLNAQMLDKRPPKAESTPGSKQLESKIAVLESKLAEAVEVSNMYKGQLHEAFSKQKNEQSAALLNLGDGEDVLNELQKLRKQNKEQEAELQDLQDRFFLVSVRLAESVAQREELLMKMKRIQGQKH